MRSDDSRSAWMTRREAIGLLGMGAGLATVLHETGETVASQRGGATPPPFPRGAIIRTVLADVPPANLGTGATLIHEHLSLGQASWQSRERPNWKFMDNLDLMVEEVKAVAKDGVTCIVDAGGKDLARNIGNLRAIATRSGMHIVAGGGLHGSGIEYPPDIAQKTESQIAEDFLADAAADRWGAIGEMGTGPAVPMIDVERKVLRAAAQAHLRTGLPILTHTSGGVAQTALNQVDLFESAGANLQQVVIGHLNDIRDQPKADTAIAIARRGAYVGFDHSGRPDDARAQEHVGMIMAVLEAGFEDKVVLSSDFANEKYLKRNGGPGIGMVLLTIVPQLRQAGVNDAILRKILNDNPRRALAFVPKNL